MEHLVPLDFLVCFSAPSTIFGEARSYSTQHRRQSPEMEYEPQFKWIHLWEHEAGDSSVRRLKKKRESGTARTIVEQMANTQRAGELNESKKTYKLSPLQACLLNFHR